MGQGFNLKILYHNRTANLDFEKESSAQYCSLEELLSQSDIISIHLPSTSETKHLIAAKQLALMKPSAVLVNTGRGNIIKESDLVAALQTRQIAAAGLDVFEHEPRLHPELHLLDNAVLVPHIGSASVQARVGMARLCADNIAAALAGHTPPNALTHITKS